MGVALASCGTSNAWSTLDAVATKVGRKMNSKVNPRDLDNFMVQVGDKQLQ